MVKDMKHICRRYVINRVPKKEQEIDGGELIMGDRIKENSTEVKMS